MRGGRRQRGWLHEGRLSILISSLIVTVHASRRPEPSPSRCAESARPRLAVTPPISRKRPCRIPLSEPTTRSREPKSGSGSRSTPTVPACASRSTCMLLAATGRLGAVPPKALPVLQPDCGPAGLPRLQSSLMHCMGMMPDRRRRVAARIPRLRDNAEHGGEEGIPPWQIQR